MALVGHQRTGTFFSYWLYRCVDGRWVKVEHLMEASPREAIAMAKRNGLLDAPGPYRLGWIDKPSDTLKIVKVGK